MPTKPQVIAAIQSKGGVGKSTLLCGLACQLHAAGFRVLVLDTDPLKTCLSFHDASDTPPFDCVGLSDESQLNGTMKQYGPTYDFVLIDTAGVDSQMASYAAMWSNLVLIPSGPSKPDAVHAVQTYQRLLAYGDFVRANPHNLRCIIMKHKPEASIFRQIKDSLKAADVPMLSATLAELTGFKEMHSTGKAPTGAAGKSLVALYQALVVDCLIDVTPSMKEPVNG
jgi:chromosome partitioning protein